MNSAPRLLTIKGRTMTAKAWSREPGAVKYWSILDRINRGWPPARAVFAPVDARKSAGAMKSARFGYRGSVLAPARPPVRLAPNPRIANPHPPTWGGFASYPVWALPLLRRVA